MRRKSFIKSSLTIGAALPFLGCLNEYTQIGTAAGNWNAGDVAHILPTVNHNRILVTVSFKRLVQAPSLHVSRKIISGQMRDSKGYFWIFDCPDLESDTNFDLRLYDRQEALCDSWTLKTFPKPNANVSAMRLFVYTCAGGHPKTQEFIPVPENEREPPAHFAEKRINLLNHGLSMNPDAIIIIGDTVYWDLSGNGKGRLGTDKSPWAIDLVGQFNKDEPILGTQNEEVLKKAVSPQIIDLYGTACRSTPVFFFNDDHDYFENDEANDAIVTFPPKAFQLELGRTVQQMYFPEFLPDDNRPLDLPGSMAKDRVNGASETFGTLRYGNLAEFLMYDCRRFVTLNNRSASFLPQATETWLFNRTQSKDVTHTIHVPSTPYGWSAGKWLEWYPDMLGPDKKLHADLPKFMWQKGWQLQHDRILKSMHDAKHKTPVVISGDLHTFAAGKIYRSGSMDWENNPIHSFVAGTLGATVFPSTFRKIKASVPEHIGNVEYFDNVEENGFSIVDINKYGVHLKMYNYLWNRDDLNSIATLEPFQNITVKRI